MSDDSAFAYAFDFIDAVFDFARIDVFTVDDDEVFQAVYDVDVAVFIHVSQVAGSEPAVFGEDFFSGFRIFIITCHYIFAAYLDFADFCLRIFFVDTGFHDVEHSPGRSRDEFVPGSVTD